MQIVLVHSPLNWKRPLSLVGYLIRKITKTYWNHASFLITLYGQKFILESDIKGVVLIPFKEWVGEKTIMIYEAQLSREDIVKAMSKIGVTKYDFASLLWFGLVRSVTGRYYGFTVERRAAKTFYCYEYLGWVMNMPNWYKVLPNEFVTYLEENKYRKVFEEPVKAKTLIK
jgi:hypothetical protein